jgi:integrase
MLTIFRRHFEKCKHAHKGRKHRHCRCPIAVEGNIDGVMVRKTLDRRDWDAAQKQVRQWESFGFKESMTLVDAYDRFIEQHMANGSADETIKKHRRLKKSAVEFIGNISLRSLTPDEVSRFRESWKFAPLTTRNTIERMRAFFHFCIDREWIEKNPAKSLKLPKIEEVDVKPYEAAELKAIEKAIGEFPNWGIYKTNSRDRVRAFVYVLRWTDMRIGDAVQLSRGKVAYGQITLRTEKNGKRVCIRSIQNSLRRSKKIDNGEYFFWSGNGKVSSGVSDGHRTLERLGRDLPFRFISHRFRHTLAVELLSNGIPVTEIAAILGNSPRVVERHYNQFIQARQDHLNEAVRSTWGR